MREKMTEEIKQNTEEWHDWRGKGIGASEAPIILGLSPWKTAYQLWEQKLGLVKKEKDNWATNIGHDFEEVARQHFELTYERSMKPALVQSKSLPFIRASLDGMSPDGKEILEIKNPGKDDHEIAKKGEVPAKYYAQIQHQLFASGAAMCHYWSFKDGSGVNVEVARDKSYIVGLVKCLEEFWFLVQNKIPPKISDQDWVKQNDTEIQTLINHYDDACKYEKAAKETKDTIREKVKELMKHRRIICNDRKISIIARAGAVDYKKIPELKGVKLDAYRKDPVSYIKIS